MQTILSKKWTKMALLLSLVVFAMVLFSGCFDLGKFDDTEAYYNSFGDVRLINQQGGENAKDYSFEKYFYNEKSVNDFAGDIVNQDEYIYLILPVKSDFYLSEFSIYLKPEKSDYVYYSLYISDFIPEITRGYSDPKIKYDSEGNQIEYDDPTENVVAEGNKFLSSNTWDSFTIKLMTKQSTELNKYHITSGKYIIVRFENNSGLGQEKGYSKLSFSITNILIRAI